MSVISNQYETITFEQKDKTAIIKLNRPSVFNALNVQGKKEIISALKMCQKNSEIRSIILTAEGKAFCSGQDLGDRTVNSSQGPVDIGKTIEEEWNPLLQAIRKSEKLIIAAINGVCAGAGLSVALSTDLKIAAPKVKFVSGFCQIGLAPDAGLSHLLVKNLGYSKSLEFAVLGAPLLSEEMFEYNMINAISENPLEEALKWASQVNQMPPLSLRMVKRNLQFAEDHSMEDVLDLEKATQRFLGFTGDYNEGVRAFFEKRPPQFKGQ